MKMTYFSKYLNFFDYVSEDKFEKEKYSKSNVQNLKMTKICHNFFEIFTFFFF